MEGDGWCMGLGCVKTGLLLYLKLDYYCIGKLEPHLVLFNLPYLHPIPQSKRIGWEWPVHFGIKVLMIPRDIATRGFVPSLKSLEFLASASIELFRLII